MAETLVQGELAVPDSPPAKPKRQGIKTSDMLAALVNHYRKPGAEFSGEILITEPQSPTGLRRCDLLRVGMWASRGTGIDVHEIKVSRSDWLRELDDPAKAEAWWPYCSRFWITTPPGIVVPAELPEGWGLMELPSSGRRFKVKVPAASKQPKLTTGLLIELLRRADNARLDEIRQLRGQHANELHRVQTARAVRAAEQAVPYEVKRRLELLEDVEKALGMPLDQLGGWPKHPPSKITPEELAAYLADARDHVSVQRRAADLQRVRSVLQRTAEAQLAALKRIDNEEGPTA